MKKSLIIISLILIPFVCQAIEFENPLGPSGDLWTFLDRIVDFLFILALPIATIMFIVGGFFFVTTAGKVERIDIAKKLLIYTFIGLMIIFSAKGILAIIKDIINTI